MARSPRHLLLLATLATALHAGCRFDDSAIGEKVACVTDDDCSFGVCDDRVCVRTLGGADSGSDAGGFDTCTPNACGGCAPLAGEPGGACGACGELVCSGADAVTCDDRARNACGGCGLLGATPGAACDTCAAWTCAPGGESLTCVRSSSNACGGCGPLSAEPDTSCGSCGNGRNVCSTQESVVCQGDVVDVCGGCDGPFDARAGDPCGCGTSLSGDAPVYTCDDGGALCDDGNGVAFTGYQLGTVNDDSPPVSRRGSLQFDGDTDWYRLIVRDPGGLADLAGADPRVTMTGAASGDLVCLFWEYSDGSEWRTACGSGNRIGTDESAEDLYGCCSAPASSATLTAQIGNADVFGGSLDPGGSSDASGVLHIVVTNENTTLSCHDYQLRLDF